MHSLTKNFKEDCILDTLPSYQKNLRLDSIFRGLFPHSELNQNIAQWRRRNFRYVFPGFLRYLRTRLSGGKNLVGKLSFALVDQYGRETDFGLVSLDMITDSGAAYIINSFLGSGSVSSLRYHALGSSNADLLVTNTTLAAELASSYSTAHVRPSGEGAVGLTDKMLVSIGLTSFSATVSCAEWGLFSQASTLTGTPAGGSLFDRATFATQGVLITFAAKTTFTLTVTSGS